MAFAVEPCSNRVISACRRGLSSSSLPQLDERCHYAGVKLGQLCFDKASPCASAHERLNRKLERYRHLHKQLWLPVPSNIMLRGCKYTLPVRARDLTSIAPETSQTDIEYLAGFFDGDGCVRTNNDASTCVLAITQAMGGEGVLVHFLQHLGGSITFQSRGQGFKRPVLGWSVHGVQCKNAARMLCEAATIKKSQLDMVANWPKCRVKRVQLDSELRQLKKAEHPEVVQCTWPYLAGFFDAEGHIRVASYYCNLNLVISQKWIPVLIAIRDFLAKECPLANASIGSSGDCRSLTVTNTLGTRQVLEQLIQAGLILKREQAELALTITPDNHDLVRAAMSKLSGNQNLVKRPDDEGRRLSRQRAALMNKVLRKTRSGDPHGIHTVQSAIDAISERARIQKIVSKVDLYRTDIKSLLSRGARHL